MAPLRSVSNLLKGSFGLLMLLALSACGGDSGSGTTGGTGLSLTTTLVATYAGRNSLSVDVVRQICEPGSPPVLEVFTDHGASVTISARLLDPSTSPGDLIVDKYTVEFRRSTDSIGAPPILSDTRFSVIAIGAPTGAGTTTTTAGVILVDLLRKARYLNDIDSGLYLSNPPNILNNYTAIYTFSGKNQSGQAFSFVTQMDIAVGSFDYCL